MNSLVEVVGHLLHHLENTFAETDSIFDGNCCVVLHHDLLRAKDVCHEVGNHGLAATKKLVAQEPHELSGSITSFKKEDVDDIIQFGKFYKGFRPIRTRCFIQLKLNGPALRLRRLSCRRKNMRRSSASSSDKSTSSFWKLVMKRGAAASKAS